jgi:hypothetical protein
LASYVFFARFNTCATDVSFIVTTAAFRTFFSKGSVLASAESHSPVAATKRSPRPICFAGTANCAPPFGPFRCIIHPDLWSSKNVRRTITALSPSSSAIAAEVSISAGFAASTVNTLKPNANRALCAMQSKVTHPTHARIAK